MINLFSKFINGIFYSKPNKFVLHPSSKKLHSPIEKIEHSLVLYTKQYFAPHNSVSVTSMLYTEIEIFPKTTIQVMRKSTATKDGFIVKLAQVHEYASVNGVMYKMTNKTKRKLERHITGACNVSDDIENEIKEYVDIIEANSAIFKILA